MYTAGEQTDISELLEKYRQSGDINVRNDIVMRSMHIVRYAVISTRNMFSKFTDSADVSNEAVLALISAVDSFDPLKNVKFDTYASIKVRGAIIDYIRRMDTVPRGIRKFAKEYDNAYSELYSLYDREPTREEVAAKMGITVEKLDSFSAKSAALQTLSFEEMLFGGAEIPEEDDSGFYQAEKQLMLDEKKSMLVKAIKELKENERLVITLYYYEKLKYSEIAQVMEISASRVCQIHSRAVEKMKDSLKEYVNM